MKALLGVTLAVVAFAGVQRAQAESPTIPQMAGQLLLVRMHGHVPSDPFLQRVKAGQIGGVVLFTDNFGAAGPKAVIRQLQAAAKAGGQPPLLIALDQEGGTVKRLPGAPTLTPHEMLAPKTAEAQGEATARNLKSAGVNVDLAPVLDVGHGGFITPRTFGLRPATVAARGAAFAAGLASGGVLATAKHFPGLGYAQLTTDAGSETVNASAAQLKADWLPFMRAIAGGIPLVMMSTAIYPALGSKSPAALSPKVVADLRRLGFSGAIVTDAIDAPAVNTSMTIAHATVQAIAAGDDLVLTGNAADTGTAPVLAYEALVSAAQSGKLSLRSAYEHVLTLKKGLTY